MTAPSTTAHSRESKLQAWASSPETSRFCCGKGLSGLREAVTICCWNLHQSCQAVAKIFFSTKCGDDCWCCGCTDWIGGSSSVEILHPEWDAASP